MSDNDRPETTARSRSSRRSCAHLGDELAAFRRRALQRRGAGCKDLGVRPRGSQRSRVSPSSVAKLERENAGAQDAARARATSANAADARSRPVPAAAAQTQRRGVAVMTTKKNRRSRHDPRRRVLDPQRRDARSTRRRSPSTSTRRSGRVLDERAASSSRIAPRSWPRSRSPASCSRRASGGDRHRASGCSALSAEIRRWLPPAKREGLTATVCS